MNKMKSQLYLTENYRYFLIGEVRTIVEIFSTRVFPVFDNIEEEAESYSESFFEAVMAAEQDDSADPADIADSATEAGIAKYTSLSLARYALLASAISTLYHLWEQQVRFFLFEEMRHVYKIEIAEFCTNGINGIKEYFKQHRVDVEALRCWAKLDELRLLCNVIKHGDGISASQLLARSPSFFIEAYRSGERKLPIHSTLLEESLVLSKATFNDYAKAIDSFWRELPERSYEP